MELSTIPEFQRSVVDEPASGGFLLIAAASFYRESRGPLGAVLEERASPTFLWRCAAFLRARGHTITAGRLYLAHFLGMEGAHLALSADPATDLLSLFGAAVIRANPFLEGRDAGYVVDWAERKMSGASGRVAVIREPPGLDAFRETVAAMLASR